MKKRIKNVICYLLSFIFLFSVVIFNYNKIEVFGNTDNNVYTVGNGFGEYSTIQEAIDAAGENNNTENNPAIIELKKGTYNENIYIDKPYIILKNVESSNSIDVVIDFNKLEDKNENNRTKNNSTIMLTQNAIGFKAENITFKNSYGINYNKDIKEADKKVSETVLYNMADKTEFENCKFIGGNNAIFLKNPVKNYGDIPVSSRAYFDNCFIEGINDIIAGDYTAYFDNCKINMIYSENTNYFASQNTNAYNLGFVFFKTDLMADKNFKDNDKAKIMLGKPWRNEDAETEVTGSNIVFLNCKVPNLLESQGFDSLSEDIDTNTLRFYEYKTLNEDVTENDISKRPDFVKFISDEQSKLFDVYSVLRGNDNWNPSNKENKPLTSDILDITINDYEFKVPLGETKKIEPILLPYNNTKEDNIKFISSDNSIFSVDEIGNIKGLKEGEAQITIESSNGLKLNAKVTVLSPRTDIPELTNIEVKTKEQILPKNNLKLTYNYVLKSDEKIDNAEIKWFIVNPETGEEIVVKEGKGEEYKNYTVLQEDIGYKIKVSVTPETLTTYGDKGKPYEYIIPNKVEKNTDDADVIYLRDGFSDFYSKKYFDINSEMYPETKNIQPLWKGSSEKGLAWETVNIDNNYLLKSLSDDNNGSLLEYIPKKDEKKWKNTTIDVRLKMEDIKKDVNNNSYFDIYSAYDFENNSYYKFRIAKGDNEKSLKIYLYRKTSENTNEELVAFDEESLFNKITNIHENPWYNVKTVIKNNKISLEFKDEKSDKVLAEVSFSLENSRNIQDGFAAFGSGGLNPIFLIDSVSIIEDVIGNKDKVRIYLAGDSTVKSYGSDNSIGGWGEFLQEYFNSNEVEVINRAEGGRSSRSFINQGRLDDILNEIKPGDYLFIQFGINDGLTLDTARLEHSVALGEPDSNGIYPTIPAVKTPTPDLLLNFYKNDKYHYSDKFYPYESGTFKWYLKQYVTSARDKGAIPVLITPISRVFFDEDGKIVPHHGQNNGYVKAVLQVADEMDTIYVDMYEITKQMYEDYGVKVTQGLQNIKADGTMDITHYNKFGSNIVTSLLIKALADQQIDIAKEAIASERFVSKTEDLKKSTLYIVGDSTASEHSNEDEIYSITREGWGKYIENYLVDRIDVVNLAVDNSSSKSFTKERNYKILTDNIKEGDYLIIQFGINDSMRETDDDILYRYTDPTGGKEDKGSFKYYLYNYYIKMAQEKKAIPIVLTPISAREFNNSGNVNDTFKPYNDAVRELVKEVETFYADLASITADYYEKLGKESKALNPIFKDGENDIINLNKYGADEVAKLILNQLKFSSVTLKSYIDEDALNSNENINITKGEYVDNLIHVIGRTGKEKTNFLDVANGKYYTNSIGLAKEDGIVTADENGNFYPEKVLTSDELIEITKRALKSIGEENIDVLNDLEDRIDVPRQKAYYSINIINELIYGN